MSTVSAQIHPAPGSSHARGASLEWSRSPAASSVLPPLPPHAADDLEILGITGITDKDMDTELWKSV